MYIFLSILPHQVKTQSLQIQNIVDTSIKHLISSQSTIVDPAFSYGRALIVCQLLLESFMVKGNILYKFRNADTAFFFGWVGGAEYSKSEPTLIPKLTVACTLLDGRTSWR